MAAVVVVAMIGAGMVRAKPGTASAPDGLDLRGVVHDKLGNIIDDGSDTGVPHDMVKPVVTTAPRATTTTLPPIPPIVPIDGDHVIAIGDSVLLGARGWMREQFPGVLLNAEVGRQFYVLPKLIRRPQGVRRHPAVRDHRPGHERTADRVRPGPGAPGALGRPPHRVRHHARAALVAGPVQPTHPRRPPPAIPTS